MLHWDEWQIELWYKCKFSLPFFAANCVWIEEKETSLIIPFNPLPYRTEILQAYQAGYSTVVDKCRRAGASWTYKTADAWLNNFYPGSVCMNVSRNEDEAIDLLDKERFILNHLALHDSDDYDEATKLDWMCKTYEIDNKRQIALGWYNDEGKLERTSKCDSLTTTDNTGRSKGAKSTLLDEWAFIKPTDTNIWRSIGPMMARGMQVHRVSTANGAGGNHYGAVMRARLAKQKGELDKLPFKYIEIDWWDTEITQEQYDNMVADMSDDDIRQEFGREFLTSGSPAFNPEHVINCYKPPHEYPDIQKYLDDYAEQSKERQDREYGYAGGIDSMVGKPSRRNNRKDMNSITFLTAHGVQAHAYHSRDSIAKWSGHLVMGEGGEQYWVDGKTTEQHAKFPGTTYAEENGPGIQVVTNHIKPNDGFSELLPWNTNAKTKGKLVKDFEKALEGGLVIITDEFTYNCLLVYQDLGNGEYGAPEGIEFFDDPVMSIMLAWQALVRMGGKNYNWGTLSALPRRVMTGIEAEQAIRDKLPGGPVVVLHPDNIRVADHVGYRPAPEYPGHKPLDSEIDKLLKGGPYGVSVSKAGLRSTR